MLADLESKECSLPGQRINYPAFDYPEVLASNGSLTTEGMEYLGSQFEVGKDYNDQFGSNPNVWNLHGIILQVPPVNGYLVWTEPWMHRLIDAGIFVMDSLGAHVVVLLPLAGQ